MRSLCIQAEKEVAASGFPSNRSDNDIPLMTGSQSLGGGPKRLLLKSSAAGRVLLVRLARPRADIANIHPRPSDDGELLSAHS